MTGDLSPDVVNDPAAAFLLVHFVEDPSGHGERIHFSLSDGGDPTRWARLNGGAPVLESSLGTTGVRDPYVVEGDGEYFIIATDLRVFGGDDQGWSAWRRHGSRSLIVWRSDDLTHWSEPWMIDVVDPEVIGARVVARFVQARIDGDPDVVGPRFTVGPS